ncbi:AsmA family protein [Pontibacter oryzae]|uniref:DUF748 domain-containing protein n=1 Tax=Pontibacter oryzae TaxID=2304593 RepID=A0A399SHK4_9BACT|nr:hypothetical protein [Pontibacter oryzae]RIJ41562.1 hypothetical protein D1627_05880 [Pontibacter oryzae]
MSQNNKSSKKAKHWLQISAWVFGISVFLFVGLLGFTNWIQNKVERMVAQQSDGVYDLKLYGLEISPFIGSMSVDSISLVPDYERWEMLQKQGNETARMLLDLQTGEVAVRGLDMISVLFGKKVDLDALILEKPKLLMTVMRRDTTAQHKPMHERASDMLKNLHIGKIDLNKAQLRYREQPKSDAYIFSVAELMLSVDDFKLDSQSFHAQDRAYYARRMKLKTGKASYLLPDGLYKASADSIMIDTKQQILLAKQVALTPIATIAQMAKAKGKATTRTTLNIPLIRFDGLSYTAHSQNNNFIAQKLLLQDLTMEAFKDKQHYKDKGTKQLIHEMAQSVKTPFRVEKLELKNGYIRYSELVPKAIERGHITFNFLQVSGSNISNMPKYMTLKTPAVIHASTKVMGKAPLQFTLRMPLLSNNGYHRIEGHIGETDPAILNPILSPTAFVRIESGHISRGDFDIKLTKDNATGEMKIIYSNLDVELLNKGSGGKQGLGKEIISEIADWVAIKDSNPKDGKDPRIGDITVNRNTQTSAFSYWKDCLASGFLSSMGLKQVAKK